MSQKIEWRVSGMTCDSCAGSVRKFLNAEGMHHVYVNFSTEEVSFENVSQKDPQAIAKGIHKLGYHVHLNQEKTVYYQSPAFKFWVSVPFTLLLMAHMVLPWNWLHRPDIQLILSLPVLALGLWQYGRSAWSSIRTLSPNMDVLILTGALSAFIYSVSGWIWFEHSAHQYLFFETTASIITLVLLGTVIEKKAVQATTIDLKALHSALPTKAFKIIYNLLSGKEEMIEIAADEVVMGDKLRVNTGEMIPADGIVISGQAAVNQSSLTGESLPVGKGPGQEVFAGTLVEDGWLTIEAKSSGKKTLLSDIIQMVKLAREEKPGIQKLADRVSAWFVPLVIIIALATFFINQQLGFAVEESMMRAIAVLVISCPCAMGLATPLAVVVGLGKAARHGILIKGADTLERIQKIKTIIFDKTGTITTGALSVSDFTVFEYRERDAKNIIFHFEKHSSHPIAQSIVKNHPDWDHHNVGFEEIIEEKGLGIRARDFFGNQYTLGSLKLLNDVPTFKKEFDIYLTLNGTVIAAFNLSDTLREGALETLTALHQQGYQTVLLSGDSKRKCKQIGESLGMSKILSRQLPDQKLKYIRKENKVNPVMMVGDGVNDAPALSLSSVGISLGNATAQARESADVILVKNHLHQIQETLAIGKETYQTIKQNLFWAFFYNVIAIPLAASGFLSPTLAALGMAFSDLVVVGNSLRIRYLART